MSSEKFVQQILSRKEFANISWEDIGQALGADKVWAAAVCHGQIKLSQSDASQLQSLLQFSQEVYDWLCTADPIRHVAPQSDPFIYRLHEVRGTINTVKSSRNLQAISIYGPAIKAVTEEEFGQKGIMSAVDFRLNVSREPNLSGDRVKLNWSGKFLPYNKF